MYCHSLHFMLLIFLPLYWLCYISLFHSFFLSPALATRAEWHRQLSGGSFVGVPFFEERVDAEGRSSGRPCKVIFTKLQFYGCYSIQITYKNYIDTNLCFSYWVSHRTGEDCRHQSSICITFLFGVHKESTKFISLLSSKYMA